MSYEECTVGYVYTVYTVNSGLGCVFISKIIYLFYSNLVVFYWEGGCMY